MKEIDLPLPSAELEHVPYGCHLCANYHGIAYFGIPLVCAAYPDGWDWDASWEECPEFKSAD